MGKKRKADPRAEFRFYIHAMAGQMAKMAHQENEPVLARLLEMAEHEAAGLGDSKAMETLRARHGLDRR